MSQLGEYYVSGGITMHAITACSILGIAAIVYKLVTFAGLRTDTSAFLREIRGALLQGNLRGALEICDRHRGPVPAVVKTGSTALWRRRRSTRWRSSSGTSRSSRA